MTRYFFLILALLELPAIPYAITIAVPVGIIWMLHFFKPPRWDPSSKRVLVAIWTGVGFVAGIRVLVSLYPRPLGRSGDDWDVGYGAFASLGLVAAVAGMFFLASAIAFIRRLHWVLSICLFCRRLCSKDLRSISPAGSRRSSSPSPRGSPRHELMKAVTKRGKKGKKSQTMMESVKFDFIEVGTEGE